MSMRRNAFEHYCWVLTTYYVLLPGKTNWAKPKVPMYHHIYHMNRSCFLLPDLSCARLVVLMRLWTIWLYSLYCARYSANNKSFNYKIYVPLKFNVQSLTCHRKNYWTSHKPTYFLRETCPKIQTLLKLHFRKC